MKQSIFSAAVLAPLLLSAPTLAKKKSSPKGGNSIETNYTFKKDTFGAGSTINIDNQSQNKGGKRRRSIEDELDMELMLRDIDDEIADILYIREAKTSRGGDSKASGGNRVDNNTNLSKIKAGNGNTFNLATQTQIKGGNTRSGSGGINFNRRAMDGQTFNFRTRIQQSGGDVVGHDGHANTKNGQNGGAYHYDNGNGLKIDIQRRGGFLSGGDAKGGSSKTKGGNKVNNKNNAFKGAKIGNGNTLNANTMTQQKGGNTRGGNGGANAGNGGAGGSLALQLPPMPMRRDLESFDDVYYGLFAREAFPDPEIEFEFEEELY